MILQNDTYVQKAEQVMERLSSQTGKNGRPLPMVTTSKIRNLLSMTNEIYNEVRLSREEKLSSDIIGQINYLKIRFVYEAGRDPQVKNFVTQSQILECLDEIRGSRERYLLFARYMEALVAYHRFKGGKDQ